MVMKIDTLVKKVEIFEKLALYGNRTDFLKAIAQDIESEYNPDEARKLCFGLFG